MIGLAGLVAPLFVLGCEVPTPEFTVDQQQLSAVRTIAVLAFSDGPGRDGVNSGTAVSAMAIDRLAKSKRFRMCERDELDKVLKELDLKLAAITDDSTAARVGKMLGADAVLVGSVTQYDMDKTQVYVYVVPVVTRRFTVGVATRLVSVRDGKVIYSCAAEGKDGNGYTQASRLAVESALAGLVKQRAADQKPKG